MIPKIKQQQKQFEQNMENFNKIIETKNKNIDILINKNNKLQKENDELYIKSRNPKNSLEYKILKEKYNKMIHEYKNQEIDYNDIITDYNLNSNNIKENSNNIYIEEIINKQIHDNSNESYNLSNRFLDTSTPFINNYTKRCKYNLCNNIIINNHVYCNNHYIEEKNKLEKIKKYTKYYDFKINIEDIPVIIEHHKYKQSNLKDFQLVHYFDINKHFTDIYLYLLKSNLTFIVNKKTSTNVKSKNKPIRNEYGSINQDAEINNILDKLVKSKRIGERKSSGNNINIKANRYKIELYNDYYINSSKYEEDEKQLFFEQENIKFNKVNKSRFEKYTRIFHKFHNDEIIRNSNYVFLPNTFKNINIKTIDMLIYKIKLLINNKYSLEEIKNNVFLKTESEDDWDDMFKECCICREDEADKDNDNGYCKKCFIQINKSRNDINSIYEDLHKLY